MRRLFRRDKPRLFTVPAHVQPDGADVRPYRALFVPDGFPFAAELDVCIDFLEFSAGFTAERRWEQVNGASSIIQGESTRAASLYYAVMSLAVDGCGIEAEILTRPLLEAQLTAAWAYKHPDEARERFTLHAKFLAKLHAEARATTGRYPDDPPPPTLTRDEEQQAIKWFGRHGTAGWTGRNMRQLAEEYAAGFPPKSASRQGFLEYVDTVHPFINWSLHSSAIASGRAVEPFDDEYLRTIIGPSDHGVRNALVHAFNIFSGSMWLVALHFAMTEFQQGLQERMVKANALFEATRPERTPT